MMFRIHIAGGGIFMRRGHRSIWGCAAVLAGFIIILSLVLPEAFWWFVFAAVLIVAGLCYMRRC